MNSRPAGRSDTSKVGDPAGPVTFLFLGIRAGGCMGAPAASDAKEQAVAACAVLESVVRYHAPSTNTPHDSRGKYRTSHGRRDAPPRTARRFNALIGWDLKAA